MSATEAEWGESLVDDRFGSLGSLLRTVCKYCGKDDAVSRAWFTYKVGEGLSRSGQRTVQYQLMAHWDMPVVSIGLPE